MLMSSSVSALRSFCWRWKSRWKPWFLSCTNQRSVFISRRMWLPLSGLFRIATQLGLLPGLVLVIATVIGEELAVRGYAFTRLRQLTQSTVMAAGIALMLDLLAHAPLWGRAMTTTPHDSGRTHFDVVVRLRAPAAAVRRRTSGACSFPFGTAGGARAAGDSHHESLTLRKELN